MPLNSQSPTVTLVNASSIATEISPDVEVEYVEDVEDVGAFFVGVATAVMERSVAKGFLPGEFGKDLGLHYVLARRSPVGVYMYLRLERTKERQIL